ncbi:MAG: RNA-binding cell elongation regulator Jag/EloR [Candidatus Aphodocola sp.]
MLKLKNHKYEGKNIEETLNKALNELNASTDEVYYNTKEIEAGGLFKSKKYEVNVILKEDLLEYIKSYLKEITGLMGINVELETQKRENYIKVNMVSDSSSILIGKNGRTMLSLQDLLRQSIKTQANVRVNVILDANDYKEKQQRNIERLAIKLAKDVVKTGIEVKMDKMNSFERRLVHNKLTEFKGVTTISEGEEPNRCVVIKPIEK